MLLLNDRLNLWIKITGVNPAENKKSYKIYMDGRLSEYDIKMMNDRIMESLEYDDSGMFAEAYLDLYFKKFIDNKNISLTEMLENSELADFISDIRTLYNSIKEVNAGNIILNRAKKAMDFYNLPSEQLDLLSVLELHSSAMNCIYNDKLTLKQFSSGNKGNDFKFSKDIYSFKSLDDLIVCSAKGKLNGVTLGYIEDKEELTDSYFSFIIKNGDNLYILSDIPKYKHPVQKGMSRCPGRNMSNRIDSNWFPYESIAGLNTEDLWDSGRYGIKHKDSKEISTNVNEDIPYRIIGNLDMLPQEEAFWLIMMVSLIEKKYYKEDAPVLPLSYTKSMIKSSLLEKTENALTVQRVLPSLDLGLLNTIDETNGLEYDNDRYNGENDYLIERYKSKVDSTILNIVENSEIEQLMIEDRSNIIKDSWGKEVGYKFAPLSFSYAPTEDEILYNQKWLARYNYANNINKAVEEDYELNKAQISATIENYIKNRLEDLVLMHLKKELKGKKLQFHGFSEEYKEEYISLSQEITFDKWYEDVDARFVFFNNNGNYIHPNKSEYRCVFNNKGKADVVIRINCKNADDLALICGISKSDLPVQLQNWDKRHKYHGNNILDNIDPFAWVIKDKFNDMNFSVDIIMSKKKYIEFCLKAGVDVVKFWEDVKPNCYNFHSWTGDNGCIGKNKYDKNTGYVLCKKCENCKWRKG